ncbi:hypothetical protein AZI86_15220 [Bdellovibrio bacteriovorus]|uniref:Uncharacterized protein n=1 Tax=Bdellovibrio bacteriovorus TaxID=959 RepID=A0A150WHK7_BDEBC|nr:hypothetical protein [Bdellovibrio bacteriovorus]KYG63068.1 hypothetical protein AZI86_15220 [Bdellovibrio bacteriovorus]
MRVLNRKGSSIPLVMIISALVFIFSYVIFNLLQSRRQGTEDDLRVLQAKMLAADIVELGKYMLLYERVVYVNDILNVDNSRIATRREMLNQSYGSLVAANSFMMNACGGYDANAVEIGPLRADNSPVFCPFYLRNPLMDGKMFEDMMLQMWSIGGQVGELVMRGGVLATQNATRSQIFTKNGAGSYSLTIDLDSAIRNPNNQFIRLHLNQNIVEKMRQDGFSAKLIFTLYGPSTGFRTLTNERYVNVQADVSFGTSLNKKNASVSETAILYSTTVKDFALFMMYPEDSAGQPTTLFSRAVELNSTSQINGRVLFNGDIDNSLESLPIFNEVVIISGSVNTAGYTFARARELMSQKFRKGIVMGFPIKLLINDGTCVSGLPTSNDSSMYCVEKGTGLPYNLTKYIDNMGNICSKLPVNFSGGEFTFDTSTVIDPVIREQCKGSAPGKVWLSGGVRNVSVAGSHAYILSPVKNLIMSAGGSLYGTVMGGHIRGTNVKIYSLGALRPGLPGIASSTDLGAISGESGRIMAGIGVPLINVALIKEAKIGE